MKEHIGVILNRLVLGFVFAFVYQIFVVVATSLLSLPLTGHVQDLISGIEQIHSDNGIWFIAWWIISTIIITAIAILIVKNKKYLYPYKQEKDIDIPQKITALTTIVVGAIISFLFFLIDLIIGSIVEINKSTDVQAIYQSALNGDIGPLSISLIFSIIAGFILVGVISKMAKVTSITHDIDFIHISNITKLLNKKPGDSKTSSDTVGLHPGALVHVGEKLVDEVTFDQIEYDKTRFSRHTKETIEECLIADDESTVTWTNIIGLHDANVIHKIGDHYSIHGLVQSDIMNTELRPKIENHDDYLQIILKLPHILSENELFMEQISFIVGKNYVLSFQETKDDIFDPIRERLEKSVGKIRERQSDYLAYALVDAIIDYYYVVMEKIGLQTEDLEEELMHNPTPKTLQIIHTLKQEMVTLRKAIWPTREVIDRFDRMESEIIQESTRTYLHDVYNHTVQVMDNIEGLREMIGGMLDTYLSSIGNKMNEVMKTLTIIASIFIPITFIAGVYGTNFSYVPELQWEGSYFVMLGVMTIIVFIMLLWFRNKKWV
ncbi:MAG TPA: magnesium/cobalt transporter CorA [Nitrosopumilaceae archaeon]|nr:magnesium/cobalt transporter CorA [Nitrosopumilaceae archaeon]